MGVGQSRPRRLVKLIAHQCCLETLHRLPQRGCAEIVEESPPLKIQIVRCGIGRVPCNRRECTLVCRSPRLRVAPKQKQSTDDNDSNCAGSNQPSTSKEVAPARWWGRPGKHSRECIGRARPVIRRNGEGGADRAIDVAWDVDTKRRCPRRRLRKPARDDGGL